MSVKPHDKQPPSPAKPERPQLTAVIGQHVMHLLGRPIDLHCMQVRPLWDAHYRVNVLIGADAASARFAHSYFLVVDGDGHILASTPRITRQYEHASLPSEKAGRT